jgi:hypothetical protein
MKMKSWLKVKKKKTVQLKLESIYIYLGPHNGHFMIIYAPRMTLLYN